MPSKPAPHTRPSAQGTPAPVLGPPPGGARRLRWIVAGLLVLVLLWVGAWRLSRTPEPSLHGRTVSSWLQDFGPWQWDTNTPACDALRALGTNAVPTLVRIATQPDPTVRPRVVTWLRRAGFRDIEANPALGWRLRAARALQILGEDARPALPLLIENLKRADQDGSKSWLGLTCITRTVPETIPTMIRELDSPQTRASLAQIVGANTNHAEVCVPYLVRCARESDPETRRIAVWALGRYGGQAAAAEPLVRELLSDTNAAVAEAARVALPQIRVEP